MLLCPVNECTDICASVSEGAREGDILDGCVSGCQCPSTTCVEVSGAYYV